jgi:hypothetical protein
MKSTWETIFEMNLGHWTLFNFLTIQNGHRRYFSIGIMDGA